MFHNRTQNNRINKLQERALRVVRNNSTSSFYELRQKDDFFTIRHRSMQKLALEMYRVKHRIAPIIMCELFNEANVPYNLRQDVSFRSYNVKTALYGTETLSYLGPKIGNWFVFIFFCNVYTQSKNKLKRHTIEPRRQCCV